MHCMRSLGRKRSREFCFGCSRTARATVRSHEGWDLAAYLAAHNSTTNPLTATALIYALGAGITAGAGTRLVLQLLLDVGWIWISHIVYSQIPERHLEDLFLFAASSSFWHWAICAPAALRRSGSHFSGSLSGIEP